MKDTSSTGKPISAKRQKILAKAFAQLRKSRAKIDPNILKKIRDIVASSPAIMKKLGVQDDNKPDVDMPLSQKQSSKITAPPQEEPSPKHSKPAKAKQSKYEKIDQGKNMEIMAKLMALKPDGRDKIKAAIKKSTD